MTDPSAKYHAFFNQPHPVPAHEQSLPTPKDTPLCLPYHSADGKTKTPTSNDASSKQTVALPTNYSPLDTAFSKATASYTALRQAYMYKAAPSMPRLISPSVETKPLSKPTPSDHFTDHDYAMLGLLARLMQTDF